MGILVLNTGSSGLKFSLFDDEAREVSVEGEVDWHGKDHAADLVVHLAGQSVRRSPCDANEPGEAATLAIRTVRESLHADQKIAAIGHRIVHGGSRFRASARIDSTMKDELDHLSELAPLHNPPALKAIESATAEEPGVPQIAVFDTSFFADLPRSTAIYPTPWEWHEDFGIRRYGFHGISHSYCAGRAAEILGRDLATLRLVVCHLGNGCSASAIRGGVAIDTSMGFTPLGGLMMGTRSGSVNPGILIYLMKEKGMTVNQIDDALNHDSGLLGVSGVSADYRMVEKAANSGNARARLALEIYAARVRSAIGAFAATLGGIDALVFTAGVGENSATHRLAACNGLRFLGLRLDLIRNASHPFDADIAEADSPTRILAIHTREDLMIAREVHRLLDLT